VKQQRKAARGGDPVTMDINKVYDIASTPAE